MSDASVVALAKLAAIRLEVRATNVGAIAFHRTLGFRVASIRRGYYDGVEYALHMVLGLAVAG